MPIHMDACSATEGGARAGSQGASGLADGGQGSNRGEQAGGASAAGSTPLNVRPALDGLCTPPQDGRDCSEPPTPYYLLGQLQTLTPHSFTDRRERYT